jgi:hypothetical protein
MKLPIKFPNEADKWHEAAEASRRMSVAERLRAIGRLTRACRSLGAPAGISETDSRMRDEGHARLRQHLQEMAQQHGSG